VPKKVPIELSKLLAKYDISDEDLKSECNKRIAKSRTKSGGPPPKKNKSCEYCGKEFGVAEMRKHIPRCPDNPHRRHPDLP
jgi:hypothetical protein